MAAKLYAEPDERDSAALAGAALQAINDDLAVRIHGSVDWEAFWRNAGYGDPERRQQLRARSRMPWRHRLLLGAEPKEK